MVGLWDSLLEGPVVLEFIRGTWCPEARRRLDTLASAHGLLRQLGARLLVVTGEDPAAAGRYLARRPPLPFPVLIDAARTVARRYGVHQRFGIERWNIARPSTFVIDRAGFIRLAFAARIRTESCDVDTIAGTLRELAAGGR